MGGARFFKTVLKILSCLIFSLRLEVFTTMKLLLFCVVITIIALHSNSCVTAAEAACSPMYGNCNQFSDCCRYLECLTYAAKCVPKNGLVVPGQDTRPLGPGPYPPNIPPELLNNTI